MRRWQNWAPKAEIIGISADSEPTKPTQPSSVGFDGSTSRETQKILAAETISGRALAGGGKSPEAKTKAVHADTPAAAPCLAACGQPFCAGCQEVRPGQRIHPPKPSQEWLDWLARWQKPKGARIQ
jgi:hypothetical protein